MLINSEKEILIVQHRVLNNPQANLEETAEKAYHLQPFTGPRKVVPVFEGDLIEVPWSDDIIMTHQSMTAPSKKKFEALKSDGLATYFSDALDKAADYKEKADFVLCLEPKRKISNDGLVKVVKALQTRSLDRTYFDSFFGDKLDGIVEANKVNGTSFPTSYHIIATLRQVYLGFTGMDNQPDIITVPLACAFGSYKGPIIYGAVGSVEKLEKLAQKPNVLGVYARMGEQKSLKMLFNSMTNRKKD